MSHIEDTADRQAEFKSFMASFMCLLDMMVLLASPKLVAKIGSLPDREHVLRHLDDYMHVAAEWERKYDGSSRRITTAHARKLRDVFSTWVPSTDVPAEVVQAARALLAEFGMEPDEGWDNFEGFKEEDQDGTKPGPP